MFAAPIIVTALFGDGDNGWLQGLRRRHFPPERNIVPAHLTLFHHLPPGIEQELGQRLATYTAVAKPQARIASVINLGRGTAFRIDSDELADIRADLAEAFRGLLIPQDQAPWRAHVTIQNKVEPHVARALQAQLQESFEPRPLDIKGLASWRYVGGPWQRIREHAFRGS